VARAALRARLRRAGAACLAALMVAGCTGGGAIELPLAAPLPPSAPRVVGADRSAAAHRQIVQTFGGEYRSPRVEQVLAKVGSRLVPASERPTEGYRITVLDSPTVNAFALPNGSLYVTRGLIALANDTSELAAVIAHEMAHVTARHAVERAELEQRSLVVSRVVAEVLGDATAGQMVHQTGRVKLASFSRQQELEADQIGVATVHRAGFDPYGAPRFLASLNRYSALKAARRGEYGAAGSDMLSTHPATAERVAIALRAARQIGAPGLGDRDRDAYLEAIDGIAFGEDPSGGAVRGRDFVHQRLGIRFTAPEGVMLEAGSDAVIGFTANRARAMRFDSVSLDASVGPADYLRRGWIEGVTLSDVETLTVNGAEAVTGVARGKEWTFRLAAIRTGDTVHRFIFAAKSLDGGTDAGFRAALRSFRQLTPEEARSVDRLRLRVVRAGPGDTVHGLAARMRGVDDGLGHFLLLNGLEANARLEPGKTYKIVTE
jgi:predicted Zn-dependent protease